MRLMTMLMLVVAAFALHAADTTKAVFAGREVTLERGGGDLSDQLSDAKTATNAVVATHSPTNVFLNLNGEIMLWGPLDRYLDMLMENSPLNIPPIATKEEVDRIVALTRLRYSELMGSEYIQHALLAQKATAMGLEVPPADVSNAVVKAMKKLPRKIREAYLAEFVDSNSYFSRYQRNYMLTVKYRNEVVKPTVTVSSNQVEQLIAEIRREGDEARAKNAQCPARLREIRDQIVSGELSFEKAAEDYSDCGSSSDGGVMGTYDYDCELLPPIREFAIHAPTNTLSDIVETENGFHLLKVLSRDPEEQTFELAQILLEKDDVPEVPEFEEARVRMLNKLVGQRVVDLQLQAWREADVMCAVKVKVKKVNKKLMRSLLKGVKQ